MLRHRIVRIEKIERPDQRIPEAVGDAPGVAAFADYDAPDAQLERRLAHAHRDTAHLLVIADEQPEVAGLGGVRRQRPADSGLVKDLGITDQAFDVRLGEEIGGRRDQQHFRVLHVKRQLDVDPGVVLDVFFESGKRVFQRRAWQPQVIADLVHLADDLVAVFLSHADRVHDLPRGHGDFGGIDAVRAEHRTATAFRTLIEVGVPLVEHFAGQVRGADQLREMLAGQGEIAAVDLAHQVLAGDRHVPGVTGAEKIVALVGARAAVHAGVEIDLQRTVLAEQLAHLGDGFFLPVLDQFAGKTKRALNRRRGDERPAVRHRAGLQNRDDRVFLQPGGFKFGDGHDISLT